MKKLLAVVVAIALVCSLSVVAFAETELYNLTNRSSDTNDVLADGFTEFRNLFAFQPFP